MSTSSVIAKILMFRFPLGMLTRFRVLALCTCHLLEGRPQPPWQASTHRHWPRNQWKTGAAFCRSCCGSIGWSYRVVCEMHITVGFGPKADSAGYSLNKCVVQIALAIEI